jgi:hypothetical protein
MTYTIESTDRTEIANYACFSLLPRIVEAAKFLITRKCFLTPLALCLIVFLVTARAQAQGLVGESTAAASTKEATGWWSPDVDLGTHPHLVLSMAEVGSTGSELSKTQSSHNPFSTGTAYSIDPGNFALAATPTDFIPLAYQELRPSDSLLSLVQTKYLTWESSLEDSRPITYVNGVSVYSLLQVSYEGSHLPVSLYVSPLRGSDAR